MQTSFSGDIATTIITRPEGDEVRIGNVSWDTGANMGLAAPIVLTNFAMGEDRYVTLEELDTSISGMWRGKSWPSRYDVLVRPTYESDAVSAESMFGGLGIPLPLNVLAALHSPEGATMPRPNLYAMSEDDGFVATMMLDSDQGIYVRYSGQWHPVTDDDVVDGLNVTEVDGSALDLFDQFDRAGQLVHVSAMSKENEPVDLSTVVVDEAPTTPVIATATRTVPLLSSAEDLPEALQAAVDNPELRWWVERRVKALGLEAELPWAST